MISLLPNYLSNRFYERLNSLEGNSGFEKLSNYRKRLTSNIERRDGKSNKICSEDRFNTNRFFYFPGEMSLSLKNCFERSFELLCAARILYPQSNPQMSLINGGKSGSHSIITFTHNKKLYGADGTYGFLSQIEFNGKRTLHVEPNEELKEGKKYEIFGLSIVSDLAIKSLISKLRGANGIVNYFNEGGQIVSVNNDSYMPYTIFGRVNDMGKYISELRFDHFGLCPNPAVRRIVNLEDKTFWGEVLAYSSDSWSKLVGEERISKSGKGDFKGNNPIFKNTKTLREFERINIRDVCLDEWMSSFSNYHKIIYSRALNNKIGQKKTFICPKNIRKSFREFMEGDHLSVIVYAEGKSENFVEQVSDFHAFHWNYPSSAFKRVGGHEIVPRKDGESSLDELSKERKIRWREIRRMNKKTSEELHNNFVSSLFRAGKEGLKDQWRYDKKIVNALTSNE